MPCYTTLQQHRQDDHGGDVIDVDVREVRTPEPVAALPCSAPANTETEEELWERWHSMSRGRQEKS